MGMYDNFFCAKSLIKNITEGNDISIKDFEGYSKDDYFFFQTKDLDNSLACFYLEEDGTFLFKKQEYKYVPPDPEKKIGLLNMGHMEPVGEPEMIKDTRNCYVDFYDFYTTEEERVFVTFTAHVKDGKLVEPISIKNVERTNLAEEKERHKKIEERWNKIRSTWQYKLLTFIGNVRSKINRLTYPLTMRLYRFEEYLRKASEKNIQE